MWWLSWYEKKSFSFNDSAIVTVKKHDYKIKFWFMTINKAADRLKNADLSEESGQLWLWKK